VSLSHVHAGSHSARPNVRAAAVPEPNSPLKRFVPGQRLDMTVLRQIDERNYLASMAGGQHVVESGIPLDPGSRVRAVVISVGDRLELKYLESEESPAAVSDLSPAQDAPDESLAGLEARYRLTLRPEDHDLLRRQMRVATDPTAMALGGLFLARLGAPVDTQSVQAIYAAQVSPRELPGAPTPAAGISADLLAAALTNATDASSRPEAGQQNDDTGQQSPSDPPSSLARRLLNVHDDGAVLYRYGTLPVLVADQLIELDLVLFQQRGTPAHTSQVRRLVMTLDTQSFGALQVEARALDNRLIVKFTGQSPEALQSLSAYGAEVHDLATRLGWNVEAVTYEHEPSPVRAARHVIDHVLAAGTVDMVF
jgi:hypothetical protein